MGCMIFPVSLCVQTSNYSMKFFDYGSTFYDQGISWIVCLQTFIRSSIFIEAFAALAEFPASVGLAKADLGAENHNNFNKNRFVSLTTFRRLNIPTCSCSTQSERFAFTNFMVLNEDGRSDKGWRIITVNMNISYKSLKKDFATIYTIEKHLDFGEVFAGRRVIFSLAKFDVLFPFILFLWERFPYFTTKPESSFLGPI